MQGSTGPWPTFHEKRSTDLQNASIIKEQGFVWKEVLRVKLHRKVLRYGKTRNIHTSLLAVTVRLFWYSILAARNRELYDARAWIFSLLGLPIHRSISIRLVCEGVTGEKCH